MLGITIYKEQNVKKTKQSSKQPVNSSSKNKWIRAENGIFTGCSGLYARSWWLEPRPCWPAPLRPVGLLAFVYYVYLFFHLNLGYSHENLGIPLPPPMSDTNIWKGYLGFSFSNHIEIQGYILIPFCVQQIWWLMYPQKLSTTHTSN
jgi:hypothetical protein